MTRTDRQARRHFFTTLAALPLLAAFAFAPEGARAQWATNGDNINNTNTGNVGVGTATPATILHVKDSTHATVIFEAAAGAHDGSLLFQRGGVNQWFLQARNSGAPLDSFVLYDGVNAAFRLAVTRAGNVGVGTTTPNGRFEVAGGPIFFGDMGIAGWGNMVARGRVLSASNNIHLSPPGGSSVYINSDFREAGGSAGPVNLSVSGDVTSGGNIAARFQDVAEWVPSRERLAAGTVVVLDTTASNHVVASTSAYDTGVAGVVSEQPGIILGEGGAGKVKVATTGRVKVKVDATRTPVKIGDLLVTGDTPGVAMKSEPMMVGGRRLHAPGTIVGKALEPLAHGIGEILVLLSLQ